MNNEFLKLLNTSKEDSLQLTEQDKENQEIIERVLLNKDISCECKNIFKNICSTLYEFELYNFDISFEKIKRLEKTFQMFLHSDAVTIEFSKNYSGFAVNVPNKKRDIITLGDVFQKVNIEPLSPTNLTNMNCPIGIDNYNNPVQIDIANLPHLLICGSTGSGKSVCLNNIITSLLLTNESAAVKFIMIDPKQVELAPYDELTNFLSVPVITNTYKAATVLWNLCRRMDQIYARIKNAGCKNIEEFNKKSNIKLQRMVVVIDELADLMIRHKKEVEPSIIRLAQMGRACGIHLILSTQRPSREVVTGLIKVNIPAKICFKVTSAVNSRVVLENSGAEKLLGNGDGLFLDGKSNELLHFQGSMITTEEIEKVVEAAKEL